MLYFLLVLLLCALPMLGFFGTQAVRLLRESWDGIIKADPSTGDIRPHGAQLLADELLAMFDDDIPQTQNAPVIFNSKPNPDGTPGPAAITVNNPIGGHAIDLNGGDITLGKGSSLVGLPGSSITVPGLTVSGSMNLNGGFYLWNGVPLGLGKGTSGTTTFLGKVVSGTGDTYVVDLYGNGTNHPATKSGVTVTVPQIDPTETIPPTTVLAPIFQFTNVVDGNPVVTYECQPPVWE